MGVFGNLLQSRWGYYNVNNFTYKKEVKQTATQIDKIKFNDCVNCFETAHRSQLTSQRIDLLKNIDTETYFLTIPYRHKFDKWRVRFIKEKIL